MQLLFIFLTISTDHKFTKYFGNKIVARVLDSIRSG